MSCSERTWKVNIAGRIIANLRFADDINVFAEEKQKLEALVWKSRQNLDKFSNGEKCEKAKLMTNSAYGIHREIKVKGTTLGTVTIFKYLGTFLSDEGSKLYFLSRIAQATPVLLS